MDLFKSARLLLTGLLIVSFFGCNLHSRPMHMPTQPTETVASYWDAPLHESAPKSLAIAEHQFQIVIQQSRFELNSSKPFQEVEIPLIIRTYRPYVQAFWSGRQVDCLVDTGAWSTIWPQWMHLDTKQLDFAQNERGPEGAAVRAEWVLSPKIVIGNLTLINIPTEALGIPKPSSTRPTLTSQQSFITSSLQSDLTSPTIGIFAFLPGVFTIDYRRRKLIVRNRDYDVTHLAHTPNTLLVPYQTDNARRVILPGTLAGHSVRFLLDTGSSLFCVSSAFAHKYLSPLPKPGAFRESIRTTSNSQSVLHNVTGTLVGGTIKMQNLYVVERVGGADVLLGSPFFLQYRITIDPFRKVILLEKAH